MLDAASSRRRPRSLFLWGVIVVSSAIAVVLGVVGYAEYHSTALDGVGDWSFLGLLYDSVRLLLVDWNISPDETLPKAIQMARLFALLSWGAAAVKGVFTLARRRIELIRCRLHRDHAVVCGLGRQGLQLVDDLMEQGIRTIAIEIDPDNPHVRRVRAAGVPVLVGSATSVATLQDGATARARFVFAVAGDDKVNIEIATKAYECRSSAGAGGGTLHCAVHIEDPEVLELFSGRSLFSTPVDGFEARLFSINRLAARALLDQYPPDRVQAVHASDDPPASILVLGTESLAYEVVTQIARIGHYGNRKKPVVRLVTSEEDSVARSVERRRAALCEFLDLEVSVVDFESLLTNDETLEEFVARQPPSIVYASLSTAVASLRLVAGLHRAGVTERAKVVVCTADRSDFALLAPDPTERGQPDYVLFGVMREACTVKNVMQEGLDKLAGAIHEDYVTRQTALGQSDDTNPSLTSWRELPESLRDANRHQADYLAV